MTTAPRGLSERAPEPPLCIPMVASVLVTAGSQISCPVTVSAAPGRPGCRVGPVPGAALNHGHGMAAEPLGICAEGDRLLILAADDGTYLGELVVVLGAQPQLKRGEVLA